MKNKSKINLNINKDDSSINDYLFCWNIFQSRPNKFLLHQSYTTQSFLSLIVDKIGDKNEFIEVIPEKEADIINSKSLVSLQETIYVSYVILDREQSDSIVSDITFFYKEELDLEYIHQIIAGLVKEVTEAEEKEVTNKLNYIGVANNALVLEGVETKIDLESYGFFYNQKTLRAVNKLVKKINKTQTGLSIIYGQRGTGKSSIIHYLSTKIDRTVVFIANNMIEHTINAPEFKKFISKYPKVMIVLDDCELSLNEYFAKSNFIVNNLIQLIDGFGHDSIDLSLMAIFNVESEEEIDHNLLDCNNLMEVVYFDLLEVSEANELSEHLGEKAKYKNKTKLIDIIKKRGPVNNKKIGF